MVTPTRPIAISFLLFLGLFLPYSSAQTCQSETFSQNRLYSTCSSLPELSATFHWTYYSSNGTADLAYRIPQSSSGWAAWALNPTSSGMLGANVIFAFHDSSGVVTVITTVLSSTSYSPTIKNETLSFQVYIHDADFSNGAYTIYATVALPSNSAKQNIVWQAGAGFQNGLPSSHPTSGGNVASATSLDFTSGQAVSGGGAPNPRLHRKNLHGVLSAVSWGILLPLGVIIARYLKVFKLADPAWFYLHVACQCSGYIIGVAGWGLGLKLGSDSKGITYNSHRDIGIALFSLATLQVFALLLRPNKDHKYRIYWNVYHYAVGDSVIVLSIVNIFKGFDILNPANKWKNVYIAAIATLGGIMLVLEVITWAIVLKRRSRSSEVSPYLVSFFSLSSLRYLLTFSKSNNESSPPSDPQEESGSSPTHAANTPLEERLSASIGVLAVNVVLFVNAPRIEHKMLDGVHQAAILLALVTSTGCVALYLLRGDATLVWPPQKRLIRMTVGFTALLIVLRFFFCISASSFLFFIVFFSLGAGFVLVYLCIP